MDDDDDIAVDESVGDDDVDDDGVHFHVDVYEPLVDEYL